MLEQALDAYQDSPRAVGWLRRHLDRFSDPLRIAVVGAHQTGKSTMASAIAGQELSGQGDGMRWFRAALRRSQDELTLIDTPAIDADAAPNTIEGICLEADAVLYLVRHPQNADLGFLHTLQDHPIARASAVNSVVVLSRADELGAGRVDALISARQIARRYRREPELQGLCQDVVPVAGLLASAGRTLRTHEFEALVDLARVPRAELEPQLMSTDRFLSQNPEARAALLERFGLFGVRLAVTLIRRGAQTQPALAAQLVPRSGLAELRDTIDQYFTERQSVLKARSALLGLEVVLRMEPHPAAAALGGELERTLASAHEFRELRLLAALRTGRVVLSPELNAEAVRLVGGNGTAVAERLGADGAGGQRAVFDAIRRWRALMETAGFGVGERRAAAVVLRSCEAMAAGAL
ncbi:GTPase domain-containing protein [Amycolatopsis acidiphila]|nr:GTPase domain-containing protein [Amycolatopsis acidiphila]UIJ60321.1 GTPase domain-containing protein [Amycolatopsis acidiphila]GHG90703.1 GTPase [Amycolatopsis acidiphila]